MSFIIVGGSLFMDLNDFYCMCNSVGEILETTRPVCTIK